MTDLLSIEQRLADVLALERRPVAVVIVDDVPDNVPKFEGTQPSSCSYWRLAAEGNVFYTVPEDHYNCAIGSHVLNIPLPSGREGELSETLEFMFGLDYIKEEEVAEIPQLRKSPGAILYAPLGRVSAQPSVVLFACRPSAAMLLNEAAMHAGLALNTTTLGRPTCMAVPAATGNGAVVSSLGCVGNRVYTGLGDDEMYLVVSGECLVQLAQALDTIVTANERLREYFEERSRELSSAQMTVSTPVNARRWPRGATIPPGKFGA